VEAVKLLAFIDTGVGGLAIVVVPAFGGVVAAGCVAVSLELATASKWFGWNM
jgi:hypothetical protein